MKRLALACLLFLCYSILHAQTLSEDPVLRPPHRLVFGDPGTGGAVYLKQSGTNELTILGNLVVTGTCTGCGGGGGGLSGLTTANVPVASSPTALAPSSPAITQSGGSTFNAG